MDVDTLYWMAILIRRVGRLEPSSRGLGRGEESTTARPIHHHFRENLNEGL